MRKFLSVAILLSISFDVLNAQVDKGQRILFGNVGVSLNRSKNDTESLQKRFTLSLSPGYGKAIKKNLVFGYTACLGMDGGRDESFVAKTVAKHHWWSAGGGLFFRKYFPLGKGFSFSADLSGLYSYSHNKSEDGSTLLPTAITSITTTNSVNIGMSTALVYAFNKKWLGTLSLNNFAGFYLRTEKINSKTSTSQSNRKSSDVGFYSQVNYNQPLSGVAIGFTYVI